MTQFLDGDRIRLTTTGEDGLPQVLYGYVGGATDDGRLFVMLDAQIGSCIVGVDEVEAVHIGNLSLRLGGTDLLDDPTLRQALVEMWRAEAESAGLQIGGIEYLGTGAASGDGGFALAELSSGGTTYVLRAKPCADNADEIAVMADLPRSWELGPR